eukprot:459549_1
MQTHAYLRLFISLLILHFVAINARFIYHCPECNVDTGARAKANNIIPQTLDLSTNKKLFQIAVSSTQSNSKTATSAPTKFKTQQYYRGIPIFDATLIIQETENGQQTPLYGNWYNTTDIKPWIRQIKTTLAPDEHVLMKPYQLYSLH